MPTSVKDYIRCFANAHKLGLVLLPMLSLEATHIIKDKNKSQYIRLAINIGFSEENVYQILEI